MDNNTKVPFVDFKRQPEKLKKEIENGIKEVLDSGQYILGKKVEDFENNFAKWCGVKYALGVNNGTSALILALLALNLKEGDEVIVQPNTFVATVEAIVFAGAKPVFADIDSKTYNLDVKKLEGLINERTKVILPVHLFGQANEMDPILELAKKHNLYVVEDCAQAHGAEYKGKKVGSFGNIGCFSFYPTKVLGACGEGGMVTTDSEELFLKMKRLRDHGSDKKYYHSEIGLNLRMSGIEGAVLGIKLNYLDQWIKERREKAVVYNSLLAGLPITLPQEIKDGRSVYYVYVIRSEKRDELQKYLTEAGVGNMVHYPVPVHLQEAFKYLGVKEGNLPESEKAAKEILSLPFYPELTLEEQKYVSERINEFFNGKK